MSIMIPVMMRRLTDHEKHKAQNNCEMGKIKYLSEVDNGYSNREAIFYYKKNLVVDNNIILCQLSPFLRMFLNRFK